MKLLMLAVIFTVLLVKLIIRISSEICLYLCSFSHSVWKCYSARTAFLLILILIKSQIPPTPFHLISFSRKLGSPASVLLIINSLEYQTIFHSFDLGRRGAVFLFFFQEILNYVFDIYFPICLLPKQSTEYIPRLFTVEVSMG